MANANPERVYNALDPSEYSEIANYASSIRTSIANSQTSIQSVCMERDETGIPTAYNSTPNTAIMYSDTSVSTGFKPNIARYSIEETVTGELQDFGADASTNGTFDTNSDWTKGAGWSIADGTANAVGVVGNNFMYQDGGVVVGNQYLIEYDVVSLDAGTVRCALNGGSNVYGEARTSIGRYSEVLTAHADANGNYSFTAGATFTGSIDNVSIKELTTKTQRTEQRLLTHTDAIPETKYYINGIEQAITPALPDADTIINLNDTAVIGYPDTIQSRSADFNVHTEILTPTLVVTGPNLYPNWELINGSHINQDIPLGTLPDGHVLAFNTGDPCNATYNDNGDGSFSYLFNQVQDHARLVLQQTIGYGVFEVGKRYRYQAKVRTVTFNPIATQLRAIHIAAAVDLVIIDADNAMIDEEIGYELKWIDFEVTDSGIGRANFRHGCGVWDVLTTAQETIELAIYELTTV